MVETSFERIERLRERRRYFDELARWCETHRPEMVAWHRRRALDVQDLIDELLHEATDQPVHESTNQRVN